MNGCRGGPWSLGRGILNAKFSFMCTRQQSSISLKEFNIVRYIRSTPLVCPMATHCWAIKYGNTSIENKQFRIPNSEHKLSASMGSMAQRAIKFLVSNNLHISSGPTTDKIWNNNRLFDSLDFTCHNSRYCCFVSFRIVHLKYLARLGTRYGNW